MSRGTAWRVLLPPRPRLPDWFAAGAAAGALLGLAEFALGWATSSPLPPPLGLAVTGADVLLVGLVCGAAGLVARAWGWRPSHSALVGATLGPLLFAPVVAVVCTWTGGIPRAAALLGLFVGCGLALGVGVLGARLGDQLERSGLPLSAVAVWVPAALALAAAERLFAPGLGTVPTLLLTGGLLVLGPGAWALIAIARRRGARSRATFGRVLIGVGVVAVLGLYAPRIVPWLLLDTEDVAVARGPANVVVVMAAPESLVGATSYAQLATADGVFAYERLTRGDEPGAPGLLALPGGESLEARLYGSGFATATIATDPRLAPANGLGEVDVRPGDRSLLAAEAAWTSGAPVLLGPGQGALSLLGFDARLRSPERLVDDARRWLLRWSAMRAPAPFFLVVDLRVADPSEIPPDGSVDRALERLLAELEVLGVAGNTWVVVAADAAGGSPDGWLARVLVRRPGAPSDGGPARQVREPVSSRALALTLWQSADGDADAPLPGV